MKSRPRNRPLLWRRGVLCGVLVVLLGILLFSLGDLAVSYRIAAAKQSLTARDFPAAIATLELVKQRGEGRAQWHYLLACAYRRSGNLSDAQQHLERARVLGWSSEDIRRQELLLQAQGGQIKNVERELMSLMSSQKGDDVAEEVYEAMARGYLSSFLVKDATDCLTFWSQWQTDNVLPHLWMADMYRRMENQAKAAEEYRKVLERQPRHPEARLELAKLLLERLKLDEAQTLFAAALEDQPAEPDALLGLAEVRQRQGAGDEARSLIYDALVLELNPQQTAAALATLGQRDVEDRQYVRAVYHLERSVALNPNSTSSHLALAAALSGLGQEELAAKHRDLVRRIQVQAARMLEAVQKLVAEPRNPDPRCEAGIILMEQGMVAAGADWIRTALAIDPGHRAANEALAGYYERLGNSAAARRHRSAAQRTAPAALTTPQP